MQDLQGQFGIEVSFSVVKIITCEVNQCSVKL